jgi:hypothetical protein
MSERLSFEVTCPNGHGQTVTWNHEEFEKKLSSDTLVFHCNTCDTSWTPTHAEITEFRKRLSKT